MADLKKIQDVQVEKVSLFHSIQNLKQVSDAIDSVIDSECNPEKTDEVLGALVPQMDAALDNFKEQVDKRIDFIEFLGLLEDKCKADMEFMKRRAQSVTFLKERIKEKTFQHIQENPDLDFSGTIKGFKIQKNGGKNPVDWKVSLQSMKDIIDPNDIKKFPEDMVKEVKVFTLNKDKFEALLAAGGISEAAALLPRGSHLRIR